MSIRALALALVVLAATASSPALAATPVPATTVLTGGLVSNDGTGESKVDVDNHDSRYHETASGPYSGTWLASDLYAKDGDPLHVADPGDSDGEPEQFSYSITGSSTLQSWQTEPIPGWTGPFKCTFGGTPWGHGGLERPESHKLKVPGMGMSDWRNGTQCPEGAKIGPTSLEGFINDSAAKLLLGVDPIAQASLRQSYSFADFVNCTPLNGMPGCTNSWSGGGTLTLKCGLCVQDMAFEQYDLPSNDLMAIGKGGITDGNHVVVTARIYNASRFTVKSTVTMTDRSTGRKIIDPQGMMPVTFRPHQTTTVVREWDTSGYAWEGKTPHSDRELMLDTGLGAGVVKVKVLPRPVVLVHGWKAEADGWDLAKQLIPANVHPDLKGRVFAVGDGEYIGKMNTDREKGWSIDRNAGQLAQYVEHMRQDLDAQHIDLVVHSMGGLISRSYINDLMPYARDGFPVARGLLMLGTPNMGSPCAVMIGSSGGAGSISTNELSPDWVVNWFNKRVINRKGVRFAIMAGDYMDWTCSSPTRGDGVVAVPSAVWQINDHDSRDVNHLDITDRADIYASWAKPRLAADPDTVFTGPGLDRRAAAVDTADVKTERVVGAGGATVTVPAGGTVDVPVDVHDGDALVAALDVPADVEASLVSPTGEVLDTAAAGSDRAQQLIRVHRVAKPAAGRWAVRLKATAGAAVARVGFALPGSALALTADGGRGRLTATLADGGRAVAGADLTGWIRTDDADAPATAVRLLDDGRHGDGAAGDGVYGADAGALPTTDVWFASVTAVSGAGTRSAQTSSAGSAAPEDGGTPVGGNRPPVDGGTPVGGDRTPAGGGETPAETGKGTPPADSPRQVTQPAERQPEPKPVPVPGPVVNGTSSKLTLKTKAARDRRAPYRYALTGTLNGCKPGTAVQVIVLRGKEVAGRATAKVTGKGCTFAVTVKVSGGKGRLAATATAAGAAPAKLALRAG